MRIFIKYDQSGQILSVWKLDQLPEGEDQPFSNLADGESVVEVPDEGAIQKLELMQIHEGYRVDPKKKKLVKQSG